MKKVLVLGGTGAIGTYLVEKLADRSYDVTVISLEDTTSSRPNLHFRKANALDKTVVTTLLAEHFDGVIDLMIYWAPPFSAFADLYLQNTAHYIYLSSYRVFADEEHPVVESSPQLLDTAQDPVYLASNDYSLHKARGERFLRASRYKNWTIVRPAITYSKKRCQLITLERPHLLPYFRSGAVLPLQAQALKTQATMSWAGDVAEMLSRLLFCEQALADDFNVTTAEHHSWETIAAYYHDIFGLHYAAADDAAYFRTLNPHGEEPSLGQLWQLRTDRLFDRIMDNRKILAVTGMSQQELMPLYDGLLHERKTLLQD